MPISRTQSSLLIPALLATLTACNASLGPKPQAYREESFDYDTQYQLAAEQSAKVMCQKGKKALLSQGYNLIEQDATTLKGMKFLLPGANQQSQLTITLTCIDSKQGATIYANAVQTRYELKADSNSTGLSVAGLGSVSLPWTSGTGTLTKVGEETLTDGTFYQRLFSLIAAQDD